MTIKLEDYLCEDVVIIMESLFEKGKVLKDYKCVGNNFGTTIILRLHDPMHETTPRFPLGKSPARQARDCARYDQYRSQYTDQGASPYSAWSSGGISDMEQQQTPVSVCVNTVDACTTTQGDTLGLTIDKCQMSGDDNYCNSSLSASAMPFCHVPQIVSTVHNATDKNNTHDHGNVDTSRLITKGESKHLESIQEETKSKGKDSDGHSMNSIEVDNPLVYDLATDKTRNNKFLKVVHDRRGGKDEMIVAMNDFIMTMDLINKTDSVYGKWQSEENELCDAMRVLSKWEDVADLCLDMDRMHEIREMRMDEIRHGKLILVPPTEIFY